MKKIIKNPNRQNWVWVTTPEFYWDENNKERADLDPSLGESDAEGWWTCDRRTNRGDLVLLYRTAPMKDIAYLIQAESNAYSLEDDEYAAAHGWQWGCDYRPLLKFSYPLALSELRADAVLRNWCAVRMQFQRRVFPIQPEEWCRLMTLIGDANPRQQKCLRTL